jgi:hypothetical protein
MKGGKRPSKYLLTTSVTKCEQPQRCHQPHTYINSAGQHSVKVSPLQEKLLATVGVHCDGTEEEEIQTEFDVTKRETYKLH